jgi:hypothetical protein
MLSKELGRSLITDRSKYHIGPGLSRKVQVLYKHLFYKGDSANASPYQKINVF